MNKFSTNVCPLCDKVLKLHKVNGVPTYECHNNHYQVEMGKEDTNQNIYIDGWCVVNYGKANTSHIYQHQDNEWKHLAEVPFIYTVDEHVIRARIQKIIATL